MKSTGERTDAGIPAARHVQLTKAEKQAVQKMLVSPCPYCSKPNKFQEELKGKGRVDHQTWLARVGKFWKRDDAPSMLAVDAYDCGDYFNISISSEHFTARFKDFKLNIINFEAEYSGWSHASDSLLFLLSAAPSDIARFKKFGLNVARVTHENSPVVVDAHTWFSHNTILTIHHLPSELSSADVTVMQEALEFFRPETRGAPKIRLPDIEAAMDKLGKQATQAQVAAEIGVAGGTLSEWLKRKGVTWRDVREGNVAY